MGSLVSICEPNIYIKPYEIEILNKNNIKLDKIKLDGIKYCQL